MLGNRSLKTIAKAFVSPHTFTNGVVAFQVYEHPVENLRRYLTSSGAYPYEPVVRTPTGVVRPTLYTSHDMLTLNEIFCRRDYKVDGSEKTIVDFGSNIGLSALYFLTHCPDAQCYLYEPDERNVIKLRDQLSPLADRYSLHEIAVGVENGIVEFGVESTGRYGGVGRSLERTIKVECRAANDVLGEIIEDRGVVDILKIDTEGLEEPTICSFDKDVRASIRTIYIEARPEAVLLPGFTQHQRHTVCRLTNDALG